MAPRKATVATTTTTSAAACWIHLHSDSGSNLNRRTVQPSMEMERLSFMPAEQRVGQTAWPTETRLSGQISSARSRPPCARLESGGRPAGRPVSIATHLRHNCSFFHLFARLILSRRLDSVARTTCCRCCMSHEPLNARLAFPSAVLISPGLSTYPPTYPPASLSLYLSI